MRKILRFGQLLFVGLVLAAWLIAPRVDSYDPGGEARLPQLSDGARIVRDEKGMPYVYAATPIDAIRVQGFVHAQDRLFQMEMFRRLSAGRLAELAGEGGVRMDTMVHLWNIPDIAQRQVALLNAEELEWVQAYVDGINAYLKARGHEVHRLVREPQPWTVEDVVRVQFFNIWGSSTNWREELLSQSIIDRLGVERAAEISQVTINADDPEGVYTASDYSFLRSGLELQADVDTSLADGVGSNAWLTGSRKSATGAPILASDPHIDARRLPGFWHPMGLITPNWRVVGGSTPGVPGIGIGRTTHFAWGATNGYGDVVDLYIETVDPANPDHYLEGENSVAFETRTATLRIKDSDTESGFREQTLSIRETRRGPVISDHGMGVASGKVITLRWSVPEFMGERMGMRELLLARNTEEALAAIELAAVPLTYVVADYSGDIALRGSGFIPKRLRGDGSAPFPVSDGIDNWEGRIPGDQMPTVRNPERDWVGSGNHRIAPADFSWTYSTHFSPSWRYRRIKEAMDDKASWTAQDHWDLQLDNRNLFALQMVPLMVPVLQASTDTKTLGDILAAWDLEDEADQSAPLIFQSMMRHYSRRVVEDDLGDEITKTYLADYYYWQERILRFTLKENSAWLDDQRTEPVENRSDLFALAAQDVLEELAPQLGDDPTQWRWGDLHTITFSHPILSGEGMAEWFGGGTHPMDGSVDTLNRASSKFHEPYAVTFFASKRMVADLSDPDRIIANIPGGITDRMFHSHFKDQLDKWLNGAIDYWWYSDSAIAQHATSELQLTP